MTKPVGYTSTQDYSLYFYHPDLNMFRVLTHNPDTGLLDDELVSPINVDVYSLVPFDAIKEHLDEV